MRAHLSRRGMHVSLSPEEQRRMREFLHALLRMADEARRRGAKPNVGRFLHVWVEVEYGSPRARTDDKA